MSAWLTAIERRAETAYRCIIGYRTWGESGDNETDVADFICDLRHLCDEQGWEWETILSRADLHYQAERES